ncbi:MAG: hypothetical protein WC734_06125 [Patescibacteria group bacterium]|jgi:hypothetical protein
MWSKDMLFSVTQSILSLVIVVGGGAMMWFNPQQDNAATVGLMGAVIGYYFAQSTQIRSAANVEAAIQRAELREPPK